MNNRPYKSIEEQRRQYTLIILTAVFLAFLIGGLPNFLSYPLLVDWRFLAPYVIVILGSMLGLLFLTVRPTTIRRDFLMLLPYDLDNERFLGLQNYWCSMDAEELYLRATKDNEDLKLPNEQRLLKGWQLPGKLPSDEEIEKLSNSRDRLLTELSQAILVKWLVEFGHSPYLSFTLGVPLMPGRRHAGQFPPSYRKFGEGKKLQEDIKLDRSGFKNPFLEYIYPLEYTFPKNTKFKLTERGLVLVNKYIEINISCYLLRRVRYTSGLARGGYFGMIRAKPSQEFDCEEDVFTVRFAARIGRRAKDIYLEWGNEMVRSLERYLHWERFTEAFGKQ